MKDFTDKEILESLKNDNNEVVRYIYRRYLPMIRLLVYNFGGSEEDSKDIFQEALCILIKNIRQEDFILKYKFITYVYSICVNLCKRELEKQTARENWIRRKPAEETENDFTENHDLKLKQKIFYEAFVILDKVSRSILNLYWEGVRHEKIASELGLSYNYVKKRKCVAEKELQKNVKKHPEYIQFIRSELSTEKIVL